MNETLYDRLGGAPAVEAAVEIFYRRILEDRRVNHFFNSIDMKAQLNKQKNFLTMAFGGPALSSANLRAVHQPLVNKGLTVQHYEIVVIHLEETLQELGVAASLIQEVMALVEGTRKDVLGL